MGIRMSDLPPKVREQVARKMLRGRSDGKTADRDNPHRCAEPPGEGARGKYGNVGAVREVGGNVIRFDSQKEARRFDELLLLWRKGNIRDLKLQEDFTLQEAYTSPETGTRVRAIRYRADFTYLERVGDDFWVTVEDRGLDTPPALRATSPIVGEGVGWRKVVEDVKSEATKTRVYEIKKKLLREKFGIEIREV